MYELKGSSRHHLCIKCNLARIKSSKKSPSPSVKYLPRVSRPPLPKRSVKDFFSLKPIQRHNRIKFVKQFAKQLGVPQSMLHAPAPSESLLSFPTTTRKRMTEVY